MKLKKMAFIFLFFAVPFVKCNETMAEAAPSSLELGYVLGGGVVTDGEYIWTIPYETNSFTKTNIQTGKKEKMAKTARNKELSGLSGYACGTYYEDENGNRFIYLAPYEVTKPLARINLGDMSIDYPIRNVGYYYGSCQLVSENGVDYLWLFPAKIRPDSALTETEIVKLNLTENIKELSLPAKINNNYVSFSGTVKVGSDIWLLPREQDQPLVKLDTLASKEELELDNMKKIYSNEKMRFSSISAGATDGYSIWFVCEDISFMFNDSVLVRCDIEGNIIDKLTLSKDRFSKALFDNGYLYVFSGADGMLPKCVRLNTYTEEMSVILLSDKKGYVPAEAFNAGEVGIYITPFTKDGRQMPLIKLLDAPVTEISSFSDEKLYRDYGDMSKGSEITLNFKGPYAFKADNVRWFASGEKLGNIETMDEFNALYESADASERKSLKINYVDELTILAEKNGYYSFMTEFVSDDGEASLYSFCDFYIDNIYERLPITIVRYDIENWDSESILECITRKKDFGAAFSFDGSEFLKMDAPMDLVPSRVVRANGYSWSIEQPSFHTISLSDGSISPDCYFADVDVFYRIIQTEPLIEEEIAEASMYGGYEERGETNKEISVAPTFSTAEQSYAEIVKKDRNIDTTIDTISATKP